MNIHLYTWLATAVVLVAVLAVDLVVIGRRPHEPSMKEAGLFVGVYVALAVVFGLGVWYFAGPRYAGEFFAGWLTEYSLSLDNLFIFMILMASLKVPRQLQQFALTVGIVLALVFRGAFIAVGAVAIQQISWVFYLFGVFLLYTAVKLVIDYRDHDAEADTDNALVRFARRRLPFVEEYHGTRLAVRVDGRWVLTSMLLVVIALGSTDLLFALDSIPAIYGLTEEPYLVFTANVFALMGLRQLFFLIGGLLRRLVYLSLGLSVILAFIGVKLVLHAMNESGQYAGVPVVGPVLGTLHRWSLALPGEGEVSIQLSLGVIVGVLLLTTVASLLRSRFGPGPGADDGHGPGRGDRALQGAETAEQSTAGEAAGHEGSATAEPPERPARPAALEPTGSAEGRAATEGTTLHHRDLVDPPARRRRPRSS